MLKLYVNFSKPGYRCCGGRTDHRIEAIAGQVEAVADLAAERRRGGEHAELLPQVVAGDGEVGQQVRDLLQQPAKRTQSCRRRMTDPSEQLVRER